MSAPTAVPGPGTGPGPGPGSSVDPVPVGGPQPRQGRYAGIVSRAVALSTDAVVLAVLSIGTMFVLQALAAMIQGVPFGDITIDSEWGIIVVLVQSALYFTVAWAVFGRTAGEALFGLRLVRRDGRPVSWARAFVRYLVTPAVFVACGLGFLWILIDRRRRTWADLLAGTVVIYDWRRSDERPPEPAVPAVPGP